MKTREMRNFFHWWETLCKPLYFYSRLTQAKRAFSSAQFRCMVLICASTFNQGSTDHSGMNYSLYFRWYIYDARKFRKSSNSKSIVPRKVGQLRMKIFFQCGSADYIPDDFSSDWDLGKKTIWHRTRSQSDSYRNEKSSLPQSIDVVDDESRKYSKGIQRLIVHV